MKYHNGSTAYLGDVITIPRAGLSERGRVVMLGDSRARIGVDLRVILDKSQRTERYSSADFLAHAGIPVWIDDKHASAHNKVMVIDGRCLVTGSFNFTKAAEEKSAENLLVINDTGLTAKYASNWQTHLAHSEPYSGR